MKRKKSSSKATDTLADEDTALFRQAVRGAVPLAHKVAVPPAPRPVPRARFRRRDERAVLAESLGADVDEIETFAGERLLFRRPEVGQRTLRRLSRGGFSVQDELDLHGMTVREAENVLREFIDGSLRRGYTCVRIVHGKGLGSGAAGPALKPRVQGLLRRWRDVLALASARQVDGGTGAVYVLLRRC